LLPGVMRRHLLESGRAVERILTSSDLYGAQRIFLANALRGLVQVSLIER
jgi:branched-subunit amino acid aminotransferase/4-amino-4-deoxychorismate lyase